MPSEVWAAGELYEPYVGRWSRKIAAAFCTWLAPEPGGRWLDVGCGTGALTEAIANSVAPARLISVDPSWGFLQHARSRTADRSVSFSAGDALALPLGTGSFDYVVSGLVLNFVADPARALSEMRRVSRAGGTIAAYVWDYAEGMQLMRYFWDTAVSLDPAASNLDEGRRFPICRPDRLEASFQAAQLSEVSSRGIEVPTVFADFDDYWSPFLGGQGPAPGYAMSLSAESRSLLRERLRAALPTGTDGSISLVSRAWAVRGTV
ncbi:MAG: methyltransferase domain-containing protein [Nocardioidaceae bacterium]